MFLHLINNVVGEKNSGLRIAFLQEFEDTALPSFDPSVACGSLMLVWFLFP
jgi:hypothetical protein